LHTITVGKKQSLGDDVQSYFCQQELSCQANSFANCRVKPGSEPLLQQSAVIEAEVEKVCSFAHKALRKSLLFQQLEAQVQG